MSAAAAGLGAAVPAAASAPRNDPTITINIAGDRTAATGNPDGLGGVVFTATGNTNGATGTCTTDASGTCAISITTTGSQTYTIRPTAVPGGWFSNPVLGVGSAPLAASNTGTAYDTITTGSLAAGGSTTVPVAVNTSSLTSRGSQLAFSRTDTPDPATCGLRVALLFDLSTSIVSPVDNLATYRAAGESFVTALEGTPSSVAVYTFGTDAPATSAPGTTSNATLPLTPVSTATDAAPVLAKIAGLTVEGAQYTNWDAGLWQIASSGVPYDAVIVLTDGDPTRFGRPTATSLPSGTGVVTRFIDVENGIFSANAVKALPGVAVTHEALIAVGIDVPSPGSHVNLRAISGPGDFYLTDFADLRAVLTGLALRNCAGLDITKSASPGTYTTVGETIHYTYTVTNTNFFTLHDVHVTDDRVSGPIPCTPDVLATGETATCHATYTITQHDIDTGAVVNTAHAHGTTPNDDPVTSEPAEERVIARLPRDAARIHLVKTPFPAEYGAPGEQITYTYTVTNTGLLTLYDIAIHDDTIPEPITCETRTLAPGESTTCEGTYTITEADIATGHVTNHAFVIGYTLKRLSVTHDASATIRSNHRPGIRIKKTAFPTEYAVPGETVTYTYEVVNTGNTALHDITVTDSRLGPVSCPHMTLAPGASMTCHATHVTTEADVAAGHIANAAIATGHPPTGPPVTDKDTETVHAIHRPAIQIQKTASPAVFGAAGQPIIFTYQVVNTGNATLRRITVTDSKVGRVSCPRTKLAPGEAMFCHATYITTAADVAAGHATNVTAATGHPPTGPPVTGRDEAIITLLPLVPVTG